MIATAVEVAPPFRGDASHGMLKLAFVAPTPMVVNLTVVVSFGSLASATATFTLLWNVAAALDQLMSGYAIDLFGPAGLVWFMVLLSASVVPPGFRVWARSQHRGTE